MNVGTDVCARTTEARGWVHDWVCARDLSAVLEVSPLHVHVLVTGLGPAELIMVTNKRDCAVLWANGQIRTATHETRRLRVCVCVCAWVDL